MNGYDEAAAWLEENADEWRLRRADTTLRASTYVGGPTERRVTVELDKRHGALMGEVYLTGEGSTILEAVQAAIGAYSGADGLASGLAEPSAGPNRA